MDRMQLETRDHEILRTLARLRFLSSAEIIATFFSSTQAGFRRIKRLKDLNLVKRHTLGVPPRSNYGAWRLTGAGIAVIHRALPNELLLEGLEERVARQSLFDPEHREALSRLYLELVSGGREEALDRASNDGVRKWTARVRGRADQIEWQADGDVVLAYRELTTDYRVVPDATATAIRQPVRLFLELDRSTKTLGRIQENLERYASYLSAPYAQVFSDRKRPWVVYVVRSEARRGNIEKLARRVLGNTYAWKVLVMDVDAVPWLAHALFGEERGERPSETLEAPAEPVRPPTPLRLATNEFLMVTNDLLKDASALFDEMAQMQPELVSKWKRALGALYARAKERHSG